jgi:hypothetical protein
MGRRTLTITDTFLPVIFGDRDAVTSWAVIENPLPEDARIINAQMRFIGMNWQELVLLLESSEWDPPEDGHPYQEHKLVFREFLDHRVPESSIN